MKKRKKNRKRRRIKLGGSSNPVGYCMLHRISISANQMKAKKCIEKECKNLAPFKSRFDVEE